MGRKPFKGVFMGLMQNLNLKICVISTQLPVTLHRKMNGKRRVGKASKTQDHKNIQLDTCTT
jgi:hypothetical protein